MAFLRNPSFSVIILFISLHKLILADDIITSTSGVTLGRSSHEPKYRIEFHPAKSPFHPEDGQESIVMSNKDAQNYLCFLPSVEETKTVKTSYTQENSTGIILDAERKTKLKTPDELLDVLDEKCFYRHEGWWSYEFCHRKHLRQLHVEDEKVVQEFILGMFDPEATAAFNQNNSDSSLLKDPRSKDAAQRYHPHKYANGTLCDLTDHPRETEIRFVCSEPTVVISSIKEIATCKYVLTVQCPMLCKHPMFQQERPTWHTIHCNEMPGDIKDLPSGEGGLRGTQITVLTDDSSEHFAT